MRINNFNSQVSPLKYRKDGSLAIRSLAVKDQSSLVKVALFEDNAKMQFERNQVVQVSSVYKKTFNNIEQLTATPHSECQVGIKRQIEK